MHGCYALKAAQKKVRRPFGCSGQTAVIEGVYNLYTKPYGHLQLNSNNIYKIIPFSERCEIIRINLNNRDRSNHSNGGKNFGQYNSITNSKLLYSSRKL